MTTVADAPVLLARDVRKTFKRGTGEVVRALDGISLEAHRGTLTALVGPDGAGKTTLIRLVAGLLTLNEGELRVLGIDVTADPQEIQSRVGYMPQKFGLYEDLTVQENMDLYADLHGMPPALFTVGSADHLLDDNLFMAARWAAYGNSSELAVYPDCGHGFVSVPIELAKRANERIEHFFDDVLAR